MILTVLEASSLLVQRDQRNASAEADNKNTENNKNRGLTVDLAAKKHSETQSAAVDAQRPRPAPLMALSLSVSLLCVAVFLAYVLAALLVPALREVPAVLSYVLPGFSFAGVGRVLLGLIESFAWGLYGAFLIGGGYNYVVTKKL